MAHSELSATDRRPTDILLPLPAPGPVDAAAAQAAAGAKWNAAAAQAFTTLSAKVCKER